MNKKKVLIVSGIVLLVILAIYLAFNPAWITHPKYMIDSRYCVQDSECSQIATCDSVNIYNYNHQYGTCKVEVTGSKCIENQCVINSFGGNEN